jgi:N-sulfoglucosamine sulfohydrolase
MQKYLSLFLGLLGLCWFSCQPQTSLPPDRPNVLLIIADDWSYPHAGVYGDQVVKTPHFDRIAREGLLFDQAFVSSPSCTPSRAAVLTGQHFWRLQEGANLYGPLAPEYPTYTSLLAEAGYHVGFTDKGWGPGKRGERALNPAGQRFDSFEQFLEARPSAKPFCFWFGSFNPHRGYKQGSGAEAGIPLDQIKLPACFPESEEIRSDVADYYKEVQDFDKQIGELLAQLEEMGQLDNTLIVVTSDNGMPFPRCKSNVYDMGTRVPLAVRWGDQIKAPLRTDDFVSLTDLAPTFLAAMRLPVPEKMTGQSLLPYWSAAQTPDPESRNQVFIGKERHVPGQEAGDWGGYPSRAIRTENYLYVYNFHPDRWPAGTPHYERASFFPSYYGDVDGGPTRTYMIEHQNDLPVNRRLFELAFDKRPQEELYDLQKDPDQLTNLAADPNYADIRQQLNDQLMAELKRTDDPG